MYTVSKFPHLKNCETKLTFKQIISTSCYTEYASVAHRLNTYFELTKEIQLSNYILKSLFNQ
jgi:hypothetical protein